MYEKQFSEKVLTPHSMETATGILYVKGKKMLRALSCFTDMEAAAISWWAFAAVMKNQPNFMYHEVPGGNHDSPILFFHEVMQKLIQISTLK